MLSTAKEDWGEVRTRGGLILWLSFGSTAVAVIVIGDGSTREQDPWSLVHSPCRCGLGSDHFIVVPGTSSFHSFKYFTSKSFFSAQNTLRGFPTSNCRQTASICLGQALSHRGHLQSVSPFWVYMRYHLSDTDLPS